MYNLEIVCFKSTKPRKSGAVIERYERKSAVVECVKAISFVIRCEKIHSSKWQDRIFLTLNPSQRRHPQVDETSK